MVEANGVSSPIAPLRALASRMITVKDLVSVPLFTLGPGMKAQDAAGILAAQDFDLAGVTADPITRYVTRESLSTWHGKVAGAATPILATDCVEQSMPLAMLVELLSERTFAFVLDGDHVRSVVTHADLQAPAVSMVVLGYLTALEAGLRQLLGADLPTGWFELLPAARRVKVEDLFEEKRRANVATGLQDCLYFADWLTIARKSPPTLERLGFSSSKSFENETSSFAQLRNALAHGGTMLDEDDPARALERVRRVIDIAERTWEAVGQLSVPWDAFAETIIRSGGKRLTGPNAIARWPYDCPVHVVTAWNPGSVVRSRAANDAANGQLEARLGRYSLRHTPATGISPDRAWQEAGFLVEGLTSGQAAELGADFGQTAVFELTATELRVLRCASGEVVRSAPRR